MAQSEPLCVYCRREQMDPAHRPFCSERCRMADLGRWLSEDYRVPEHAPAEDAAIVADPNEARSGDRGRDDEDD